MDNLDDNQRRDALLLKLLKTPPQPRSERARKKAPSRAKTASRKTRKKS